MLALTRKKSETIMIGDNIEVVVLSVQGEQVRLGVIAPRDIPVHRKEVFLEIQQENVNASKTDIQVVRKMNEQTKKGS